MGSIPRGLRQFAVALLQRWIFVVSSLAPRHNRQRTDLFCKVRVHSYYERAAAHSHVTDVIDPIPTSCLSSQSFRNSAAINESADGMIEQCVWVMGSRRLSWSFCLEYFSRDCACQGWDMNRKGASFSFGCSWSVYYNGCKFARSHVPRKFKLRDESFEGVMESKFQALGQHLAPLYQQIAPMSYGGQVSAGCQSSVSLLLSYRFYTEFPPSLSGEVRATGWRLQARVQNWPAVLRRHRHRRLLRAPA